MKRALTILGVLLALAIAGVAQNICAADQYDMLQWLMMDAQLSKNYHLAGTANPHYDLGSPKYLVSMKGALGYPWDIDTYDSTNIYQWITEDNWNDPTTFKAFSTPLPWMPRCINVPSTSGKLSSLPTPTPTYSFYSSGCVAGKPISLGNAITEVWGPYGSPGDFPADADYLELSYRYSCDVNYDNCTFKEAFDYQQNFGLVRWTLYQLLDGGYEQQQQSLFNLITAGGSPKIDFPCPLP